MGLGIETGQIRIFLEVAVPTGERQIIHLRLSSALLGDDVLNVKRPAKRILAGNSIHVASLRGYECQPRVPLSRLPQNLQRLRLPVSKEITDIGVRLKFCSLVICQPTVVSFRIQFIGASSLCFWEVQRDNTLGERSRHAPARYVKNLAEYFRVSTGPECNVRHLG